MVRFQSFLNSHWCSCLAFYDKMFLMGEIKLGKYRHFKGKEYEVIGIGNHSETLEKMVIYRALYESKDFGKDTIWIRPYEMFVGTKNIEGKEVKRFEYIGK